MFKDKLKKILNHNAVEENSAENNKKKIENLVFLIILLIGTIVIINYIWKGNKSSEKIITNTSGRQLAQINNNTNHYNKNNQDNDTKENIEIDNYLEKRLEDILSNITGGGTVKVFINYAESSQEMAMYNENSKTSVTEEKDTSGGLRKIEQTDSDKQVVYKEENGSKSPIIQKTVEPKIEGAIITAKGASDINVKTNIIQAVEAATGLATHKIQVFEAQ